MRHKFYEFFFKKKFKAWFSIVQKTLFLIKNNLLELFFIFYLIVDAISQKIERVFIVLSQF